MRELLRTYPIFTDEKKDYLAEWLKRRAALLARTGEDLLRFKAVLDDQPPFEDEQGTEAARGKGPTMRRAMNLTYENFPEQLRQQVEGFDHIYQEHMRDYDELLPHVLLGDLVRFLIARVKEAGTSDLAVQSALALLKSAANSGDGRLQNLISVSVLENLDPDDPHARALKDALAPWISL